MRRRRATHMQAVEEEVERLSNENSLLLHRMSQLVASHQQVDSENQQLRHELQCLRQSVVSCPPCTRPCAFFTIEGSLAPSQSLHTPFMLLNARHLCMWQHEAAMC